MNKIFDVYQEGASSPVCKGVSFSDAKEAARRAAGNGKTVNVFRVGVSGGPYLAGFVASWGEKWTHG
jgi:hypothetical protein